MKTRIEVVATWIGRHDNGDGFEARWERLFEGRRNGPSAPHFDRVQTREGPDGERQASCIEWYEGEHTDDAGSTYFLEINDAERRGYQKVAP